MEVKVVQSHQAFTKKKVEVLTARCIIRDGMKPQSKIEENDDVWTYFLGAFGIASVLSFFMTIADREAGNVFFIFIGLSTWFFSYNIAVRLFRAKSIVHKIFLGILTALPFAFPILLVAAILRWISRLFSESARSDSGHEEAEPEPEKKEAVGPAVASAIPAEQNDTTLSDIDAERRAIAEKLLAEKLKKLEEEKARAEAERKVQLTQELSILSIEELRQIANPPKPPAVPEINDSDDEKCFQNCLVVTVLALLGFAIIAIISYAPFY